VTRPAFRTGLWRHVCMTLAAFAVLMKVLIPQGFMLSGADDAQPFQLVICTSQGPMVIEDGKVAAFQDQKAPAAPAHDQSCGFAGHGLGAPPPSPLVVAMVEFAIYQPAHTGLAPDIAPGRGLTGPPLPARGPPVLLS
jgi:hypothetical protein